MGNEIIVNFKIKLESNSKKNVGAAARVSLGVPQVHWSEPRGGVLASVHMRNTVSHWMHKLVDEMFTNCFKKIRNKIPKRLLHVFACVFVFREVKIL